MTQLVTDDGRITVLDPSSWKSYGPDGVRMKLGVRPGQVADYLALVGDSTDNYPGCPGIGPRRAAGLLAAFGTLDRALAAAAAGEVPGVSGERLRMHADVTLLCRALATARRDAPLVEVCLLGADLAGLFRRLDIQNLPVPEAWPC